MEQTRLLRREILDLLLPLPRRRPRRGTHAGELPLYHPRRLGACVTPRKILTDFPRGPRLIAPPKILSAGTPIIYPTKFPAEIVAGTPFLYPTEFSVKIPRGPRFYTPPKMLSEGAPGIIPHPNTARFKSNSGGLEALRCPFAPCTGAGIAGTDYPDRTSVLFAKITL